MAAGGSVVPLKNFAFGNVSQKVPRILPNFHGNNTHSETLMQGLNSLRSAAKLFDVALVAEGRTFKAHRVVLASCSDYFTAMFTDAMLESRLYEIKMNEINASGLELILDYIYTSKLELDLNNVQDVLPVATHVQLNAVIDACSNFLESQIDIENCVAIAELADLYSLENLKRKTYRFICSRFSEFAKTSDFVTLRWEQMKDVLSCNFPVDCAEEEILEIALDYCRSTKLETAVARRLFKKVHFEQISRFAWNLFCRKMDDATDEATDIAFYKEICAEWQAQLQVRDHAKMDVVIPADVLINSRGMELALVKIGGFETNGLTNQISCYLPSKGKWEILTKIPHIEQCNYGSAVLGNDLYIVGGSYDVCLKEYIHPFGFRYNPSKNKWKTIAPIQADRCRFSLNAMGNNFLYAVGGVYELNENDGGTYNWGHDLGSSNCERYNATTDSWEYLPALCENRSQHAGVVVGDRLYISGGIDRHMVLASFWCFDAIEKSWHKLSAMPTARADHVLIAHEGRIYACGGWYEDAVTEMRVLAESIDVFDLETKQWSLETCNPTPKFYTGVAAVKRKIYFVGGLLSNATFNRATCAVECYDLDTKEWSLNTEWEYPNEVWESTCAAFYVPTDRVDISYFRA